MSDVAAAAGVAQSTVSRILNDTPAPISVSEETRERVRRIARELGYSPHPIARALRGAPTNLLGAIVRDITDPFFAGAIEELSVACKRKGYSVVLGHARATEDEALAVSAVLEARQCDAIVLLGDFTAEARLVDDLARTDVRVVGVWHGVTNQLPFPIVGVDNRAGVIAAVEHLVGLGHSRIAYVGVESLGDIQERSEAYRDALSERDLTPPAGYHQVVPNRVSSGDLALPPLLALRPAPTAILAATDTLALGLLHAAHKHGVRVPEDLSVVGFDDIPMAAAGVPALTTVRMPVREIIAKCVDLCVGETAWSGAGPAPLVAFQPELVVRASTAAPAA
jgi:DNA-binding LacI/PurR family transcriptional regulator